MGGVWQEYETKTHEVRIEQGTTASFTATIKTIPGFKYNPAFTNFDGNAVDGGIQINVVEGGTQINFYYSRNSYHYLVKHVLQTKNGDVLFSSEKSENPAKFESLVTVQAKDSIDYNNIVYEPSDLHRYTFSVRHEQDRNNPILNVITFYYEEKTVQINYAIVGPAGCGKLTVEAERVPMYSGEAAGSTAVANDGFVFVGWFYEEACENPVNGLVADNKLTPTDKSTDRTYYAKFEETYASLTIKNTGVEDIDANQSFLYLITSEDKDGDDPIVNLKVAIVGNGFVTINNLPAGTYIVTQVTDWSWRYEPAQQSVDVILTGGRTKELTVVNSREATKWLDGNDVKENDFQ